MTHYLRNSYGMVTSCFKLLTKKAIIALVLIACAVCVSSCYRMRTSKGGGQIDAGSTRKTVPSDILLSPGYKIEVVADGLTFPSAMVFDDQGRPHVIETGYSYGEVWGVPKLIRLDGDGKKTVVAQGEQNGPWNGLAFHGGNFYVSEGGHAKGGRILRVSKDGVITTIVADLPSLGDHHTNGLVIHDGYIYFAQGTATNSAVVGEDNADFGWLTRKPDVHDIPCMDVTLTGENFESPNILTDDPDDAVLTGAYVPYGTQTSPGQVIKGSVPCSGAIMRIPVEGGHPEVFAWGLRNPFGLAVSAEGILYTTENAFDDRGSRPVWGAGDVLWRVEGGAWYGWPDFSEGRAISNDEEFKPPSDAVLKPLLQSYPAQPPKPAAVLGVHSSACGLDFSTNEKFGYAGEVFVARFGDMAPAVGKVLSPVGFKIVRVDVASGVVRDFAVNKGKRNGPASWLKSGGLERPVSVRFDRSGETLYVVDFGVLRMTKDGPEPKMNTGAIWKISKME